MSAIAIVGAGPGLGLSIAKLFGANGYDVALIARDEAKLSGLVNELEELDVSAAAFTADVTDGDALTAALGAAGARFGAIEVLEFSPYSGFVPTGPLDVTAETLEQEVTMQLSGAVTATRAVAPAMLEAGRGTLLFTVGRGAISPVPILAALNAAQAGLRNWVHNLNGALADTGVYAGVVAIGVMIGETAPEGVPHLPPDEIAQVYWDLHTRRDRTEQLVQA
jgi:short-subunit dehydrogenase